MVFSKTLIATSVAILSAFAGVNAAITPTEPAPGTIWTEGQESNILWTDDGKAAWKNFKIDFMTGDNNNQKFLTNVATGLDPKSAKSFKWKAPTVDPHSAIYFFKFTGEGANEFAWTTRFTIVGADGKSVPPTESKQPTGEDIPWGVGKIVGADATTGSSNTTSTAAAGTTAAGTTAAESTTTTSASTSAGGAAGANGASSSDTKGSASADAATSPTTTTKPNSAANSLAKPAVGLVAAAALAGFML
ncbi:hypothetical protein DFQ28_008585 [Apophysomyces sp. BC1034]|nr:hypothetical protein DFQ30_000289 [Apophysomyces sp. BC1015]KAG0181004.1 hypothetical protein DFQ29_009612 [Apophysomyces sp. BC1021]KAG0192587.1 hypothetical protein DFQ28_008585 [Apophysomyces sp. BC1034]